MLAPSLERESDLHLRPLQSQVRLNSHEKWQRAGTFDGPPMHTAASLVYVAPVLRGDEVEHAAGPLRHSYTHTAPARALTFSAWVDTHTALSVEESGQPGGV